jgi:predicted nucleic acid-binding protein
VIFVDSNIFIDIAQQDPHWFSWSAMQLQAAGAETRTVTNAIVVGELAPGFPDLDELLRQLDLLSTTVMPVDGSVAFLAGQRFVAYCRTGTDRRSMLPDFLIGAHAVILGARLLTRDARLYRRFFPELSLITPEDDHG